jgi:tRNA G37 N-methylase TrmD
VSLAIYVLLGGGIVVLLVLGGLIVRWIAGVVAKHRAAMRSF